MRLDPLESPRLFPDFVSCYSARLVEGDHRLHFAAGRECAARAMAQLGLAPATVERGPAGEPLWPEGVTGSITHKRDYVSAAVARTTDLLSIGIDAEEIVHADQAARIARIVMLPQEADVGGPALPLAVRVSLLFSIKEAVFKCLYPLVRRRFYYEAVCVAEVDLRVETFRAVLAQSLTERVASGTAISGRICVMQSKVFSMVYLARIHPGPGDERPARTA